MADSYDCEECVKGNTIWDLSLTVTEIVPNNAAAKTDYSKYLHQENNRMIFKKEEDSIKENQGNCSIQVKTET